MTRRPIIAIDGPAGSGKSSTARAVAQALGFVHVDSGALYRACTLVALDTLGAPAGWTPERVVQAARQAGVNVRAAGGAFEVLIGGFSAEPAIRDVRVNREVSRVAAMSPVRDFVNGLLRAAATQGGIVMDGRDIGTVVFPDAEVKIYMVADPSERARRRLLERGESQDRTSVEIEAGSLTERDARDSRRDVAPLMMADGATLLDTTQLTFDEQVRTVVKLAARAGP